MNDFVWKRNNVLVLVVGKLMFSYNKFTNDNLIINHEVAENGND